MNNASEIIVLVSNILVLIATLLEIRKLKNELRDKRIVVNNLAELKESLKYPLEGVWKVTGKYSKYHNIVSSYNCSGYAHFYWDNLEKRYNVFYSYSVREEQANEDLATAVCQGTGVCDEDGSLNKKKLHLLMSIENRSAVDSFNSSSQTFQFISDKVKYNNDRVKEIRFNFKNSNVDGVVKFVR